MIILSAVLEAEDVERARTELAGASWRAGKATAGAAARGVKENLQAGGIESLGAFIREALARHALFEIAARPRQFSPILFSKYEPGMAYGAHTDDALMGAGAGRLRTDLAFTLFLSDADSYDGGALVIESAAGEQEIRLAPGDAVLYAASTIHRVAPVTRGARLAAVGWVQSLVRDGARREILFDLALARANLSAAGAARADVLLIEKSISNLLRLWAEL